MAIREGRWDCAACGRTANLGRDLRCAGCGRARGKVKFYLPSDEPAVQQAEMLAMAKAGPDWVCGFCDASNRSTSQACTGCGAPREEGASRVTGGADATELTAEQRRALQEAQERAEERTRERKARAARNRKLVIALAASFFVLCSGTLTLLGFTTRAGGTQGIGGPAIRIGAPSAGSDVSLLSKAATRRIDVEAERLVAGESWCSSMPSNAHELGRESRAHGTRQVCEWRRKGGAAGPILGVAGFRVEDLGNGFFSDSGSSGGGGYSGGGSDWSSSDNCRSETVYDDWCTWEALRWIVVRSPESVDSEVVPPWPAVDLLPGERKGSEIERYEGTVESLDGERITLQVSQSQWLSWRAGSRYEGSWSFFGGLRSVGEPVRAASASR